MTSQSDSRSRIADTWRRDPVSTLSGAERHSRFVFIMRLALPIMAFVLIAVVLIYSVAYKPNIQIVLEKGVGLGTGAVSMEDPRLTGLDALDRYFVVNARDAKRLPNDPDTVTLTSVAADITKHDDMILRLRASKGHVFSATNVLEFGPLVEIDLPEGYSFVTESTSVEMETGMITGGSPVRGGGPLGEFSANHFSVNQEEDIFQLKGNVQIKVDMAHMRELNTNTETNMDEAIDDNASQAE